MVDDFHSTVSGRSYSKNEESFSGPDIVDINNSDPIFHTIYDLDDRFQVPGAQYCGAAAPTRRIRTAGPTLARHLDDKGPHHGGDLPQHGLGDAWEWSDDPRYDEKFSGLAYRIDVNYWVYDLTH